MTFTTPIETIAPGHLRGPSRRPAQLLADQEYGGGKSVHDDDNAELLGLSGAPIEGPTHFSQFDPLCVEAFGSAWFERGCLSAHFLNMVVEGEEVVAELTDIDVAAGRAAIAAHKADGTPVLSGTATVDPSAATELDERRARLGQREVGDLYVIDQLAPMVGEQVGAPERVTIDLDSHNGPLYPFTLAEKLATITERSTWYDGESPWGGPILPTEMLSVLTHQRGADLPVRRPSIGLFIDLEVRYVSGPVRVGQPYDVSHTLLQVGQSRAVESWWTSSAVTDADTGVHVATVVLHQGVFKASFAGHPDSPR